MKRILFLATSMVFLLGFGLAYAEENLPKDSGDKMTQDSDKMIRDDDIQRLKLDPDLGTVNQMPAGSGAQGSGAGGVMNNEDSWKTDKLPDLPSVDKPVEQPAPGTGTPGDTGKDKDMGGGYHYGY